MLDVSEMRLAWVVSAVALTACAGVPRPSAFGESRTPEQLADHVYAALKADDIAAVVEAFDPRLAQSLSSKHLREVWRSQVDTLGNLKSWKLRSKQARPAAAHLEYELTFERGRLLGDLGVNTGGPTVAGIFFRPAPEPDGVTGLAGPRPVAVDTRGIRGLDLSFGKAPYILHGTLTFPDQAGPHPAVLLVHGSGPQDRDETLGPNKPFRDLAEALSARGLVVLRYDKRTLVHRARMNPSRVTVEDEVLVDALAALDLLRSRAEARRDAVFVVGHSLGALLAPELALRDGKVAGVALLAPPGRSLSRTIVDQVRFLKAMPQENIAELERQSARIETRQAGASETFMGIPVGYFLDLGARDPFAATRALKRPVLLLRGSRDFQVTGADLRTWLDRLQGLPDLSWYTLEGLNHLFIAGQGPPGPAEYHQAGHVAPQVSLIVAAFIKNVLATAR